MVVVIGVFFVKEFMEVSCFFLEILCDAAIKVYFGISFLNQHAFNFHEFIVYGIKCAGDFISPVK